jgi:hypothetical protein
MRRALRLLRGVLVDLRAWASSRTELRIDMRRVNFELRRAALAGLEEDVVYRDRVKRRIREGARCSYPPLIDRNNIRQLRRTEPAADLAV